MTKLRQFLYFVILALLFNFGQSTIEQVRNEVAHVHVLNGLPKKSEAMKLECRFNGKSLGARDLGVGQQYSWIVKEKTVYYCQALWGRLIGSWHGFEPSRDANHATVFWLVKDSGFYFSWDNSTWVHVDTWQAE